jgi:hypothetical protein
MNMMKPNKKFQVLFNGFKSDNEKPRRIMECKPEGRKECWAT